MITNVSPVDWRDLQNRVSEILNQCGFRSEVEKKMQTLRGEVEIDVYAEENIKGRKYSIICECKHWKSAIPQNVIHGFRTVVQELGSNIGYIISTSSFQSGSIDSSQFTNIELLTWEEFQNNFFESWYENFFSPQVAKDLDPLLSYVEYILPRWFDKLSDSDKESYLVLKEKYHSFGWIVMSFTPYARMGNNVSIPSLPLSLRITDEEYVKNIPSDIMNETAYLEFMEKIISYGNIAIAEFRQYRDKVLNEAGDYIID